MPIGDSAYSVLVSSLLVEVSRLSSPLSGRVEILSTSKKSMHLGYRCGQDKPLSISTQLAADVA